MLADTEHPFAQSALLDRRPPADDLFAALRFGVDRRLAVLLRDPEGAGNQVSAAMRYATLAPGKRIRPLLLLLTARSLGLDLNELLDAACALEMVHAASLVMDDMPCMDNAMLRRGQPTVHVAFGQDVAMLSAIALLTSALRTTAVLPGIAAPLRTEMVAALSNAVGLQGLVTGQFQDLHDGHASSAGAAEQINDKKTGALFAVAFELAAIAAGSSTGPARTCDRRRSNWAVHSSWPTTWPMWRWTPPAWARTASRTSASATLVAQLGTARARRRLHAHVEEAQRLLALALPADTALLELTGSMFRRTVASQPS